MNTSAARLFPFAAALAVAAGASTSAQAGQPQSATQPRDESGLASWYGPRFHGRRTSSGEIYDQHRLTAAHPFAPLGTRMRVTVQSTGRSVVVTVNDRLPHSGRRVLDLSRAAAAELGMISSGIARVTVSPHLGAPPPDEPIEVAEAPDDLTGSDAPEWGRSNARRSVRATRVKAAARPCCTKGVTSTAIKATAVKYRAGQRKS